MFDGVAVVVLGLWYLVVMVKVRMEAEESILSAASDAAWLEEVVDQ